MPASGAGLGQSGGPCWARMNKANAQLLVMGLRLEEGFVRGGARAFDPVGRGFLMSTAIRDFTFKWGVSADQKTRL